MQHKFLSKTAIRLPIPAVLILFITFFCLWKVPQWQVKPVANGEKRIELENASRTTLAQILGGGVLLVGLYFTWRNLLVTQDKQITERFTAAIELLGAKEKNIRLGGIYALERVAKDSPRDHWAIMEILTSFIRETSTCIDITTGKARSGQDVEIQAALTVVGRRNVQQDSKEQKLDLQNANLSDFTFPPNSNFSQANFRGANLTRANLQGARFANANFRDANLRNADLEKADLTSANFIDANLEGAKLEAATLISADLRKAFLYNANFKNANLCKANLEDTHLRGAMFNEAELGKATFDNSVFWKHDDWEKRHWTSEEHMEDAAFSESNQNDYDECPYDEEHISQWKPDFRQSKGITINQLKAVKDEGWKLAIYDDALRRQLEIPDYSLDDVRG